MIYSRRYYRGAKSVTPDYSEFTKSEIKKELDKKGIYYPEHNTKTQLLKLLVGE